MIINFRVHGIPKPGGSKRAFKVGNKLVITDANPKVNPWKDSVVYAMKKVYEGELLRGSLRLIVTFCMPRPKNHFGTGNNQGVLKKTAPIYHTTRPDCTKLVRSLEDALNKILWVDDSQIAEQRISKIYDQQPGAIVSVEDI